MSTWNKLAIGVWFFLGLPLLVDFFALGLFGTFLYLFFTIIWCWELFVCAHYRYCRQEEFMYVLKIAAATEAPVEGVLKAYWEDRPAGIGYRFWVACLLFFVFPGYYWIHVKYGFDARVGRLLKLLNDGYTLDRALAIVPGLVTREMALAVTVGQFSSRPKEILGHLTEQRSAPSWLEFAPRLMYPLLIMVLMLGNLAFLITIIVPKYERIFADFKIKFPPVTDYLVSASRGLGQNPWIVPAFWLLLLVLINVLIFSSRVKWYFPVLGHFYRLQARGEFLQTLGLMMETGKPLPLILEHVNVSGLLPKVVANRSELLAADLAQGQPLAPSLTRHGLATKSMQGLIGAAVRAQNLPWALQALGDSLIRRSARFAYRITMVLFPISVFLCACLVAFVAVGMFAPLAKLMDGLHGK